VERANFKHASSDILKTELSLAIGFRFSERSSTQSGGDSLASDRISLSINH